MDIKPKHKYMVRQVLMLILVFHVGMNVIEYKETLKIEVVSNDQQYQEFNFNIDDLNVGYDSLYNDNYQDDIEIDQGMRRDNILLDTLFSLFLFHLVRYGKGKNDREED